jgi:hypothetical protein
LGNGGFGIFGVGSARDGVDIGGLLSLLGHAALGCGLGTGVSRPNLTFEFDKNLTSLEQKIELYSNFNRFR